MNETSHKICARRFRSEVDDVVVDQVVRGGEVKKRKCCMASLSECANRKQRAGQCLPH